MVDEINFYSRDDEYGWMSNFSRNQVCVDGVWYLTNEHYYQTQKTTDLAIRSWIRNAPHPYLAMAAGRALRVGKEFIEGWDLIKVDVMLRGLRSKFGYNSLLKQMLIDTGTAIIHEDAPRDMFWGKKGKDMLGKLLMVVREELKNDAPFNFKCPYDKRELKLAENDSSSIIYECRKCGYHHELKPF